MFKHYLTTALRYFRQHKVIASMNIACLSLGLTCFLLAWGVTAYYSQADRYHVSAKRTLVLTTQQLDSAMTISSSPWLLAEHLRADFPQLEAVARAFYPQEAAVTNGKTNGFANVTYGDAEFLTVFDLPFAFGDKTALDRPRSAIVSRNFAKRLFGTEDAIGKTFRLSGRSEDVSIGGVVGDVPQPSHISTTNMSPLSLGFEVMLSMDMNAAAQVQHRWDNNWYFTYVVLPEDGTLTAEQLNAQLDTFAKRHIPSNESTSSRYRARPISEFAAINLNTLVAADRTGVSSMTILKVLGGLVLLVACLNYANLATAQAVARAKEVAMRRVVGAHRGQLMAQHLMEGALLTATSLIVSIATLALIAASSGSAALSGLAPLFAGLPQFWILLASVMIVVSVLTAVYPALVLARVRPAQALRGGKVQSGSRVVATLLVGLQFGSASFLLIAVLIMATQNKAMKEAVWNPASDPVVVIANDLRAAGVEPKVLKEELLRLPGVRASTSMHRMPWGLGGNAEPLSATAEPGAKQVSSAFTVVDADVLETLDLRLLAGRTFSRERAADLANMSAWNGNDAAIASDYNIVVDTLTVDSMGFGSPQDAIGKILYHPTSQSGTTPPQRMHIIGVTENSLIRPISLGNPSFYLMNSDSAVVPVVRVSKENVAATLAGIDAVWKKLAPEVPLKRRFADEQYNESYRFLNIVSGVFSLLAGFAFVIAAMGLIGMALHIIRRRTHEIGVRKTLGASVGQILWLLLRSFSKPIVIANLTVWPLVYVVMRGYLSLFAVSAGLTLTPFAVSLLITLSIAWLAVVVQATRAARMNPALVLRHE